MNKVVPCTQDGSAVLQEVNHMHWEKRRGELDLSTESIHDNAVNESNQQLQQLAVRVTKAPGAPKRFKSSFIFFSTWKHGQIREQMRREGTKKKMVNVAKIVSAEWRSLSPEKRRVWEDMARADRERFEEEKAKYDGPWKVVALPKQSSFGNPDAPKRPVPAYLAYSNEKRSLVKAVYPNSSNGDVSKILASMWKEASESVRRRYLDAAADERKKYNAKLAAWEECQLKERFIRKSERDIAKPVVKKARIQHNMSWPRSRPTESLDEANIRWNCDHPERMLGAGAQNIKWNDQDIPRAPLSMQSKMALPASAVEHHALSMLLRRNLFGNLPATAVTRATASHQVQVDHYLQHKEQQKQFEMLFSHPQLPQSSIYSMMNETKNEGGRNSAKLLVETHRGGSQITASEQKSLSELKQRNELLDYASQERSIGYRSDFSDEEGVFLAEDDSLSSSSSCLASEERFLDDNLSDIDEDEKLPVDGQIGTLNRDSACRCHACLAGSLHA